MSLVSRRPHDPAQQPSFSLELDFAWRTYIAIQDGIYYVDQKAATVLLVATAVAGLAANEVFSAGGTLHDSSGLKLWAVRAMGVLFALAVLLALNVVLPQLRRRHIGREAKHGLIYFGHLRHRTSDDIARAFSRLDSTRAAGLLAAELHATSKIAWRKNARLQAALMTLVAATACFMLGLAL